MEKLYFCKKFFQMDTNVLLLSAIRAAVLAGRKIMEIYTDPLSDFEIEKKADNSPLTIADRCAHQIISGCLEKLPYPILSEEGRSIPYQERRLWPTLWIVNPLDGTKEFIKRNGEFTVNIALVNEGIPVLGVIYVPVSGLLYFGDEENGAYKATVTEKADIQKMDIAGLRQAALRLPIKKERPYTAVASRSHMDKDTEALLSELKKEYPDLVTTSVGSSLKICLVAEGAADIYPRNAPTMEWDTAAGHALLRAAGMDMYRSGTAVPLCYNKEDLHNPFFIALKNK